MERDPAITSSSSFSTLGWISLGFIDLSTSSWSRKFHTNSGPAVSLPIPAVILLQFRALGVSVSIIKLKEARAFCQVNTIAPWWSWQGFSILPHNLLCQLCLPILVFWLLELYRSLYEKATTASGPTAQVLSAATVWAPGYQSVPPLSPRFPWFRKPRSTHALKPSVTHHAVTKTARLSTECITRR